MKNFCIRISKAVISFAGLAAVALTSQAQGTITVNGTQCTTPWSISASASGTIVNVPAACLTGTPVVCTATGAPTISSFTPAAGNASTLITISGTNLCAPTSVTVNGTAATGITTSTGGSLTAIVGAGTTTGPVVVTTASGTATSASNFTVAALVTLTSVSPNPVVQGGTLTVTGTNFVPGSVIVNIGSTPLTASTSSATSATVLIPASIANGSYQVTVATNSQVSAPVQLTVGTVTNGACGTPGVDCSIEGDVIPNPSRVGPLSVTPPRPGKENSQSDPDFPMNAYAAENISQKCSNANPAISRLWQHNIDFSAYTSNGGFDYPYLARGQAMTWKFTAPATEQAFGSSIILSGSGQVAYTAALMTLSDRPCDFDISKANVNACYKSGRSQISIYYRVSSQPPPAYECQMIPGKTYYLNMRMQNVSPASESCNTGLCGGTVKFQ
jgi:IPT/TIG domain